MYEAVGVRTRTCADGAVIVVTLRTNVDFFLLSGLIFYSRIRCCIQHEFGDEAAFGVCEECLFVPHVKSIRNQRASRC